MWPLLRYGAVFVGGQLFQHLMERRSLEQLERGEHDLADQLLEAVVESLYGWIGRLREELRR